MHNHLHFYIMDETLVGVIWFSILWILLPYACWRSDGMELYKGNQWWKLAWYLFLITTAILVIVLFSFVWNWNDNGGRPANIPTDEGCYITANELVGIIMLLWTIFASILSCVISYIAKRLLCKNKETKNDISDKVTKP